MYIELYSNIPHNLGLIAIEHWTDKFPNLSHDRLSKYFVLKSLQLILENNCMHFNDIIYKQKVGTAMGNQSCVNLCYTCPRLFGRKTIFEHSRQIWSRLCNFHKKVMETLFRRLLYHMGQ